MSVLVTGASGFLGSALILRLLQKGHKVYALSRHPPAPADNLIPLEGDILLPNLGLMEVPVDIHAVVHCAALLSFKAKDRDRLYRTNHQGTVNLLEFMGRHKIARLFHVSTAYLFRQNHYEISKEMAEDAIKQHPEIKTTVIRPSIIIGDSKVEGLPPLSGFYLGIAAIDRAKRSFEKKTGVWSWRATIRIRADEGGNLNLIPVDRVAGLIAEAVEDDREGVLYGTHPTPVSLTTLERPISDAIGANIKMSSDFKPNAMEKLASALMKELSPYLLVGRKFPSDIDCPPLTEGFLTETMEAFLRKSAPPRSLVQFSPNECR